MIPIPEDFRLTDERGEDEKAGKQLRDRKLMRRKLSAPLLTIIF